MTYFDFLLRFLAIPIFILLVIAYLDRKQIHGFKSGRAVWMAIGIHVLLAVIYTTPWDNYLVATGVWYYNPDLVTGIVLGYVPIEEYTFFILETVLTGLWWWFLACKLSVPDIKFQPNKSLVYVSSSVLILLWLLFSYIFFFGAENWTYFSIILFWALPPIFLQMFFGADILWHYRKLVAWAIFVPGVYLSLMDIFALKETTWSISPAQTTGILFFGILPIEEVLFFFITNVMLIFGITLLLAGVSQGRFAAIKKQVQRQKEKRVLDPQSH